MLGRGQKIIFFTLDKSEPLFSYMDLSHLITSFVLKETEKKAWGVNFFHFLRLQNPYVPNLEFGTGVLLVLLVIGGVLLQSTQLDSIAAGH